MEQSIFGVTLRRDEQTLETQITTAKLNKDVGEQRAFPAWGLTAQEITARMAREWRLESTEGVVLTGVLRGGAAQLAEPPLERRDVVRRIDGRTIANLEDLIAAYEALSRAVVTEDAPRPSPFLIELERRGTSQLSVLTPRIDHEDDPPRELPKAWIGVATQPVVPRLAELLDLEPGGGFRVTRVYPESEAAKSGLGVGDVILALNGEALRPTGLQDSALLARRVRDFEIEDTVTLSVQRNGTVLELPVVLERTRLTREEARRHNDSDFEVSVRELTFFDRDENRWDSAVRGVLVENVDPGGWAGLGGLRPSDLVLRINDQPIRGLKSFRRVLKAIKLEQPEKVVVVVLRGVKTHFQYLEPEWTPARR
ncbi:MAG: PDZ domain-containing protein [Acidobacteriota bacterium]